jgi:hypothetical protein
MRFPIALLPGAAVALIAALPVAAQPAAPAPSGQANVHHAMPQATNLQVLPKDISAPDLIATMRGFTKALGVGCEFCHAEDPQTHRPNFASDAKPDKNIARIMMRMTQEINAKYLSTVQDPDATPADKTVTCGTCHRGNTMPLPFNAADAKGAHHSMPMQPKPE